MSSNNQPSFPQLHTAADTPAFLDSVRADISYSWNRIEYILKVLQDRTNQIESLRVSLDERNTRIGQMQLQFQERDNIIRQKDYLIQQKESTIQENESTLRLYASWTGELQAKIASYEKGRQKLFTENENLKAKLSHAGDQSRAVVEGFRLTDGQRKVLLEAVNKELSQRANFVNTKAKEAVVQLLSKSQQRIAELEEELRLLKANNITPSTSTRLIESKPETNPDSDPSKNALVTLPNFNNDNPHQQQPGSSHEHFSSVSPSQP